jgi:D-tyrosyl-tRNA(Tyr) deacylase
MRIVIQRVQEASVSIEGKLSASIQKGFLVLLGIEEADTEEDADYLVQKLCQMRVFADEGGKMNLDIAQVNGALLVVSQFTLHASTRKGNRPSFIRAARPEKAIPLYDYFITRAEQVLNKPCQSGTFGADMQISLVNDGPVTILMDSKNKE